MVAFGFKTQKSEIVDKFVKDTDKRLNSSNFMKNPFNGMIRKIAEIGDESFYGVHMKPIYFPFYWFGLLLAFGAWFFMDFQITWFMLPGLLIFLLGIFYSSEFFYTCMKIGVRKARYKDKIKRVSKNEVINIALNKL